MNEPHGPPDRGPLLAAELLLAGVSVVSLLGGLRIFSERSFLAPVIGAALLAHLLVALLRRAGRGVGLAALVSAAGVAALQLWVHYAHTTRFLIPQGATLEAVSADFRGAQDILATSQVPIPAQTGLIVATAAIAWAIPVLADWAAFRVGSRGEALVPAGIVFVIVSFLGTPGGRVLYAVGVVTCAVAFGLAQHRAGVSAGKEPGGRPHVREGRPRGLLAGALAVGSGTLIGTILFPALVDAPLSSLLDGSTPTETAGRKVVISPLSTLPGQLQRNPDLELFTVASSDRAYWRLTALGDFDGEVWSLDETTKAASGSLQPIEGGTGPARDVAQSYRIGALAAIWLPAAYQPVAFEPAGSGFGASFEPLSSTLLVGSDHDSSDSLSYSVVSAVPSFDDAFLRTLRNDPDRIPAGFTTLPEDINPSFGRLAAEVTAGATGPYEQALALQNWFRTEFDYDLEMPAGHSLQRLSTFLFADRRGFCEQFAGAFATLARTIGLPARVAVGFTPGIALDAGPGGTTIYSVRGRHAHAWPEVYINGAGWVAFEPTPGRGAPGAEAYTFVAEQQDAAAGAEQVPPEPATPPATAPEAFPTEPEPPVAAPDGDTGGRSTASRIAGRVAELLLWAVAAAGAAGACYVAATAALRSLQRRRLLRWAADDAGRNAAVSWQEVINLLRPRRIRPHPAETPIETAERAARLVGAAPEPWRQLALGVSTAAFARGPMPKRQQAQVTEAALEVTSELRHSRSAAQRLRAVLDPEPWRVLLSYGPLSGSGRSGRIARWLSRRAGRGRSGPADAARVSPTRRARPR